MEVLKLLLLMEPLLGALGPQLARPRALDLDNLLGGRVLAEHYINYNDNESWQRITSILIKT